MSYTKHNFAVGGAIKASDFNEMDNQILKNANQVKVDASLKTEFDVPQINDNAISTQDTWSSSKINSKINDAIAGISVDESGTVTGAVINDNNVAIASVWSSAKVVDYINENGGNKINDSLTNTDNTWSSNKINSTINTTISDKIKSDGITNTTSAWSGAYTESKINNLSTTMNEKIAALIYDNSSNGISTWSSEKISGYVASSISDIIKNDYTTSNYTVWSSDKTKQYIDTKVESGSSGSSGTTSGFSGDYNDLTNKPTIPDLTGYATQSYVKDKIVNSSSTNAIDTTWSSTAIKNYVDGKISNDTTKNYINTTWSSTAIKNYISDAISGIGGGSSSGAIISDGTEGTGTVWSSSKTKQYVDGKITTNNSTNADDTTWSSTAIKDYIDNSGFASKTYVDGKISDNNQSNNTTTAWSSTATKNYIDSNFAKKSYVDGKILTSSSTNSDTTTWSSKVIKNYIESAVAGSGNSPFGITNAIDYGFYNNGTTDNLDKWNSFVNNATNGDVIVFPKGEYYFSGQISFKGKKLRVLGTGWDTVIKCGGHGFNVKTYEPLDSSGNVTSEAYYADESCIELLTMIPASGNKESIAINIDGAKYCTVDRIHFQDSGPNAYWAVCIELIDPWYTTVSNCHVNNKGYSPFQTSANHYRLGDELGIGIQMKQCVNICLYNNYIRSKMYGITATDDRPNMVFYDQQHKYRTYYCDGVQIEGGNVVLCNFGVNLIAGSNFVFNNLLIDQSHTSAYVLGSSQEGKIGMLGTVYISNAYISCYSEAWETTTGAVASNESTTISINGGAKRIYISDCTIRSAKRNSSNNTEFGHPAIGIYSSSNMISITGCDISGQNGYETNYAIGADLGCQYIIVSNNIITDCNHLMNLQRSNNNIIIEDNIIVS